MARKYIKAKKMVFSSVSVSVGHGLLEIITQVSSGNIAKIDYVCTGRQKRG